MTRVKLPVSSETYYEILSLFRAAGQEDRVDSQGFLLMDEIALCVNHSAPRRARREGPRMACAETDLFQEG